MLLQVDCSQEDADRPEQSKEAQDVCLRNPCSLDRRAVCIFVRFRQLQDFFPRTNISSYRGLVSASYRRVVTIMPILSSMRLQFSEETKVCLLH